MNIWKVVVFGALSLGGVAAMSADQPAKGDASPAQEASATRYVKGGVIVDLEVKPKGKAGKPLTADDLAEVRFKLTEEATGKPVRGATPGAWMDMGQVLQGRPDAAQKSCKDKIGLYLQGAVGIRPMIDLNSYFVVVMNADPSIAVVDPVVSMAGKTSTLAKALLPAPGADWVKSSDNKRIYITTPRAGKVAVVESEGFKVTDQIDAGKEPTRIRAQPDGRYLWVGNDSKKAEESGVTVIDADSLKVVGRIATGGGHHEIAFSGDSRYAFVTNRDDGTVTVIDVAKIAKIKDIKTGPLPISIGYASQAQAVYVADGKEGTVTPIEVKNLEPGKKITLRPGLGPLRFEPRGRYGLVVNPSQDAVFVIDAASNTLVNTIKIKGEPFQVFFSESFAYIRSLQSERVSMIALPTLGEGSSPTVQSFAAGSQPPQSAGQLVIADTITAATSDAAVFVVNPADNTTYYYMEGMNAPSSNYQVMGSSARAVTVVDRTLKEVEPGIYATTVKIPAPGHYDVAFILQNPNLLHCFAVDAQPNPLAAKAEGPVTIEYQTQERTVNAGQSLALRFRLKDANSGKAKAGVKDVRVLYFLAPGRNRQEVAAREVGDGVYEAEIQVKEVGAYYMHVRVPSLHVDYNALPSYSVRVVKPGQKG